MTSMEQLLNAVQYLAAISASLGGPQSSVPALESAKLAVDYWLTVVIDERIELATGARP